jgi:predicted nucleic acid-binding protein
VNLVLDASVALAWCFEDEGGDYVDSVLEALRAGEAVVASHWGLEIANGLIVAERRRRVRGEEVPRLAKFLMALPIGVDPAARGRPLTTVHRLARTHGLSTYDAAYLELAIRHGIPIATLDRDLRGAAEAEGVAIFAPE